VSLALTPTACRTRATAQNLAAKIPNTTAIAFDVSCLADLDTQIVAHDVVSSPILYIHHTTVIESAIKNHTNVVTTRYMSPSMRSLDAEIKAAGTTVLDEVGVDPSVDHIYAIKKIDEVLAQQGGSVRVQFYSYCGGLAAPECANHLLGFKFSWSPRGALLLQQNSARYLKDSVVEEISAENLMAMAVPYYVVDGYKFVSCPDRNSVPFREYYGITEAHMVVRGSLRYKGQPDIRASVGGPGVVGPGKERVVGGRNDMGGIDGENDWCCRTG
jgi:saccharopine dehydrogenase (NADP+, L-glutamate forming)